MELEIFLLILLPIFVKTSNITTQLSVSSTTKTTRGSKFWSSKVCEGGESREAYACRLNFGPPQFLFEIKDHVTQTHFWSAFRLIENSLLVQFELMKVDQK